MSIFLFAVGAILRFAVTVTTEGVNLHAIGNILMLVGAIGALFSLVFWTSWGGFGRYGDGRYGQPRDTVVTEPRDTVVVERERPRRTVIERETRI